jgi:PD-(D/E)XK nuclease superfamily protein
MPPLPPALPPLRSRSRKGDIAETLFTAKALRLGFRLSKPVSSDCRYDLLVDAAGRYRRVQIKSVWGPRNGSGYAVHLWRRGRGVPRQYRPSEVDFIAAYIAEEEAWYIIPIGETGGRLLLHVYPHVPGTRGKFERFREAWHLLLPRGVKIGDLKAMADPACEDTDPSVRAPLRNALPGGQPLCIHYGVTASHSTQPRHWVVGLLAKCS